MVKNIVSNVCTGFGTWLCICSAADIMREQGSVAITDNGTECRASGESRFYEAVSL